MFRETLFFMTRHWRLLGGLLLTFHFALLAGFAFKNTATFDEPVYIASGVQLLRTGSNSLNPDNGLFPELWPALPLVDVPFRPELLTGGKGANDSAVSLLMDEALDHRSIVFRARLMNALLSVCCGLLLLLMARRVAGTVSALFALCLYSFFPAFISNGALATAEIASTLFFFTSCWTTALVLRRPNLLNFTLFAVSLTLLAFSKMSAPVFALVAFLILLCQVFFRKPMQVKLPWRKDALKILSRKGKFVGGFCILAAAGVLVALALWCGYGLRQSLISGTPPSADVANIEVQGLVGHCAKLAERMKIFAGSYLHGLLATCASNQERWSFLNGEISKTGHSLFFPKVYLMKTPPAILFMTFAGVLAVVLALCGRGGRLAKGRLAFGLPFAVFSAVYLVGALSSHLNIGYRHLLPVLLPSLLLCAFGFLLLITSQKEKASVALALAFVLAGWAAFDGLRSFPNSLAYFNPMCGGMDVAYRHVVDSSLDWGQDLENMKPALARHGVPLDGTEPVYLSYFGTMPPSLCGFEFIHLWDRAPERLRDLLYDYAPGYYCFSATMAQGIGCLNPDMLPFLQDDAEADRAMKFYHESCSALHSPRGLPPSVSSDPDAIRYLLALQTVRLSLIRQCLLVREPDFLIGGSILVYKVDADFLRNALGRLR